MVHDQTRVRTGYEVLLVDLDGTVVDYDRTEDAALRDVHGAYFEGRLPLGEFRRAFHRANDELWAAYRRREIDLDRLRVERFARLGAHPTPPGRLAALFERRLGHRVTLFADALPALRALAQVTRLVLVTDGIAAVQHAKLRRSRIRALFEHVVVSTEVGHRKPDPRLLRYALALAGAEPRRALVVGDSQVSDGEGARRAGLDFCWVNRGGAGRGEARHVVPDLLALVPLLTRPAVPVP
ncbi:MAG: HAD-IA family hydrolase [Streptosporangiales bacterium]|nr:HAD-IA family hydrolase [Streptosporangiales bacterium]